MPVINEEVSPNETSEYGHGNTQTSNKKVFKKKKSRPVSSYSSAHNVYGSSESPGNEFGSFKKKKKSKRGSSSITYSSIEYNNTNSGNNQDELQNWQ